MKPRATMFILSLCILWAAGVLASAESDSKNCDVAITTLRPGQEVGGRIAVEGTARIPPHHHLWLFARHESFRDFEEWWPQGEGNLKNGKWRVFVTFGVPQDLGDEFDVSAAVFDEAQLPELRQHRKDNQKMTLPPAVCASKVLMVKKTRD